VYRTLGAGKANLFSSAPRGLDQLRFDIYFVENRSARTDNCEPEVDSKLTGDGLPTT